MIYAVLALIIGLLLLVWSADKFVEGAAGTAKHFGMPPLLIGMVIIGFGTSAPEMIVSALAASQGNPGIALGNAFGSNIANIALILGVTALISPIAVHSKILKKELPILTIVTAITVLLIMDMDLSRLDAAILLGLFASLMGWTIYQGNRQKGDHLAEEIETEAASISMPLKSSVLWLIVGLLILIGSSRMLVWGAVEIAQSFGVSDVIIGLTIVAVGTSLPELASSVAAARKNEHDIAIGNVIGSNLFNTLAVVGIAGAIHPLSVETSIIHRDAALMGVLTLSLFVLGYGFKGKQARINRYEGAILVTIYAGYTAWLVNGVVSTQG